MGGAVVEPEDARVLGGGEEEEKGEEPEGEAEEAAFHGERAKLATKGTKDTKGAGRGKEGRGVEKFSNDWKNFSGVFQ
jgi:hypothetical protein